MKLTEAIEARRKVLEQEHGQPFLTVAEAAAKIGITTAAIYIRAAAYGVMRYDGSVFVPLGKVEERIQESSGLQRARKRIRRIREAREETSENYLEIRGVEHVDGIGRSEVVRHCCLPCRRFFRSLDGFESHDCVAAPS